MLLLTPLLMVAGESVAESVTPISRLWISKNSPYAGRTWIASIEKKIDVDLQFVDLYNKSKEFCDLYSQISPDISAPAKIPIFEDADGFKLIESAVIVQYLDEKFPNSGSSLIPQLASEKAVCRLFIDLYEKTMSPLNLAMVKASGDSLEIEKIKQTLPLALKTMNRYLEINQKSGPFILSDRFSFAEVMVAPFIQRLLPLAASFCSINLIEECEKAGCSHLIKWIEAVLARESVSQTKVEDEKLIEAYTKLKGWLMKSAIAK
jgi:glutathione S-transferase